MPSPLPPQHRDELPPAEPTPEADVVGPLTRHGDVRGTPFKTKEDFAPDELGQFYFRDAILDELDRYMVYIGRMKATDPGTYALYSRIGARIIPKRSLHAWDELEPWFRETLPTFGCIALCVGTKVEEWEKNDPEKRSGPRFVYFTKFKHAPAGVQAFGTVYIVTAYFDWIDSKHSAWPIEFAVGVLPNGEVKPLQTLNQSNQVIRHRKRGRGLETSVVQHQKWGIPPHVKEWFNDQTTESTKLSDNNRLKSPIELMKFVFIYAANAWTSSHASMINVMATRGNLTAAFSVDVKRTPYFFKDRDVTLTARGRKARIFHVVRPHARTLRDGRTLALRMHFRGLRQFRWNGYEIHVSVPGRDHLALQEFNVPSLDKFDPDLVGQRVSGPGALGWAMARHVRQGWKTIQRMRTSPVGHG